MIPGAACDQCRVSGTKLRRERWAWAAVNREGSTENVRFKVGLKGGCQLDISRGEVNGKTCLFPFPCREKPSSPLLCDSLLRVFFTLTQNISLLILPVTKCLEDVPTPISCDTSWMSCSLTQFWHYQPGVGVRSYMFRAHFHKSVPTPAPSSEASCKPVLLTNWL